MRARTTDKGQGRPCPPTHSSLLASRFSPPPSAFRRSPSNIVQRPGPIRSRRPPRSRRHRRPRLPPLPAPASRPRTMSNVPAHSELDALLAAVDTRHLAATPTSHSTSAVPAPTGNTPQNLSRPGKPASLDGHVYDFKRPERVSKDQM